MSLAIFDLDNTLIAGDSDHLWGEFLVEKALVDTDKFKQTNDAFFQDYRRGEFNIHAYLRFALKALAQFDPDTLAQLHQEFMQLKIAPLMLDKAHALIYEHRVAGDTLIVITATNRFVTQPIVKLLGIDNLLASEGELRGGRYTGEPIGTPCFAEGKVTRLQQWLAETGHSLKNAFFYSDSHNDLPLLRIVDNPVAVDPDAKLEDAARAASWPIISLR